MKILAFLIFGMVIGDVNGQTFLVDEKTFTDGSNQLRYDTLMEELRCLVCQNQSLADSSAGLAQDLRKKVVAMIEDGSDDQEIKDYMVQRYGEFILYRPRLNYSTIMLWFGPFILLVVAIGIVVRIIRSSQPSHTNQEVSSEKKIHHDGEHS
ncbi:MAG: cytochrome c-type biogenesis protein CcmH [Gammaproteobacteria bacterium]|nr:cytochrome C biogenesis protein [Thiotrichales bacterium]|tara:strand:- start:620 stop:1075 length:456 start_codon:yes stop_codon:yes gene_type:complete